MEIFLQGKDSYGLKDWNGNVEVAGIKMFQLKRITASRNILSIFRKFFKILQGDFSPVTIPAGLKLDKLDIQDFTQILVASIAQSGGRSYQKTYQCQNKKCKALNPRVVDIVKCIQLIAPVVSGGVKKVALSIREPKVAEVTAATIAPNVPPVSKEPIEEAVCHNVTIDHYLQAYEVGEVLTQKEAKEKFKDLPVDFDDEEEFIEFKDLITDLYLLALSIDIPNKTLEEKVSWLANLQGDDIMLYRRLADALVELSPTVNTQYVTKCSKCGEEIKESIEVTDYFFGLG